jgi:quinolinate synthase
VHQRFTPQQIADARAAHPDVTVIVHPECRWDTVQASDLNGSTEFIAKTIANAPAGSTFAVGTEINLVSRLAKENPDKTVFCLDPVVCPCSTMFRVHPAYLAWTVESLVEGRVVNQIVVPEAIAANAKLALDRMLTIT